MTDFERWMLLPKFKIVVIDNPDLGKFLQIIYGDLKNDKDVVNSCFEHPETIEKLASHLEASLNSLLRTYHLQPKEINYAIS